ncbi:hypothetical protein PF005_g7155 [Phytophthora fragariae]|uniref:Uncharacterized protein n=1 Tax=Phytophthora fragariae TaxID=53985 RepID=A0A6A3YMM3_9STRA|nr:hypothetical protein PF003_g28597 [Phytophthora fragariae]KAE8942452.1 hypothetical protein PF009_g7789 [Phytophthora fragariae]KAE9127240.1 hypothetical protein PF007_g5674 [Phytophthora fragariae]KAE9150783.1 hypothetical protein PF006_g4865 [Phytophthora fragariae]KAE9221290.1 hypothetical protein PF005_g7155 [Phytophthora fragariae]
MKQPLQKMKDEKAAEDQRAYLSYSFSRSTGRRKAEHEQDDLKLWSQTAFGKAQEKKSKELKELGVVPPPASINRRTSRVVRETQRQRPQAPEKRTNVNPVTHFSRTRPARRWRV